MDCFESSEPFLKQIVDEINIRNGPVFDIDKLAGAEQFILKLGVTASHYVNHGGITLVFLHPLFPTETVIKVSKMRSLDGFGGNPNELKTFTESVSEYILPVLSIIYEDKEFFIYEQRLAKPVSVDDIPDNPHIFLRTISMCCGLWEKGYYLDDISYNNLGWIGNKVFLFDYDTPYDCKSLHGDRTVLIHRIMQYIQILCSRSVPVAWSQNSFEEDYGKDTMEEEICRNLRIINTKDPPEVIECLKNIKGIISCTFKMQEEIGPYQTGHIDQNGCLTLCKSTLSKYNTVRQAVKNTKLPENFTFIDAGCNVGLIGLKVMEDYSLSRGTFNNIDTQELEEVKRIGSKIGSLVTLNRCSITDVEQKYDLVIYFSLVHHLLRGVPFAEVIRKIFDQTVRVAVVEFPVRNDILMQKVKTGAISSHHYDNLESTETVTAAIRQFSPDFKIDSITRIDYGTQELERYAFILVK